ncbi:unnamed protein product, partial [Meganyctiphanes norvegica]
MIMEAYRGVGGGSPHTSPAKRSFDVAFLTGATDATVLHADISSPSKLSRVGGLRISPTAALTTPVTDTTDTQQCEDAAPSSAFKKVAQRPQGSPPPSTVNRTLDAALSSSWPPMSASFNAVSSLLSSGKSLAPLLATPGLLPNSLAPFLPHATPDRLNNNLVEEYIKSQHHLLSSNKSMVENSMSPTEALSRLRSSIYASDPYKLPFGGMNYPLPGSVAPPTASSSVGDSSKLTSPSFLSPGPSIASLMPASMGSMALPAQNMCAKCNISFRMTSDLVYHMRSQHKREPDPYKKRRDEKLKCTICQESFRERHHLTRHMSAHQDRRDEETTK